MDLEFVIPSHYEGLEEPADDGRYFVDPEQIINVAALNPQEIDHAIALTEEELSGRGSGAVFITKPQIFNRLYSIVQKLESVEAASRDRLCTVLCDSLVALSSRIAQLKAHHRSQSSSSSRKEKDAAVSSPEDIIRALRIHRNALKMHAFLLSHMICSEMKIRPLNGAGAAVAASGKGKKKVTVSAGADVPKMLSRLASALDHDVEHLWGGARPEPAFANLFAQAALAVMQDDASFKSSASAKRDLKDVIFHLLVGTIPRLDSLESVVSALVTLVIKFEHMGVVAAELVQAIMQESVSNISIEDEDEDEEEDEDEDEEDDGLEELDDEDEDGNPIPKPSKEKKQKKKKAVKLSFGRIVVREICAIESQEFLRDQAGAKNVSQFLCELSDKCPRVVMEEYERLAKRLEDENYAIRNAAIHGAGKILSSVVSTDLEQLSKANSNNNNSNMSPADQEKKETLLEMRDFLLQLLEERLRDNNVYVRNKVVQTWTHLVESKNVIPIQPTNRLNPIVDLIRARLKDKGAFVRRSAVQFLCSVLANNPFGDRLDRQETSDSLKSTQEQMDSIELDRVRLLSIHEKSGAEEEEEEQDRDEAQQQQLEEKKQKERDAEDEKMKGLKKLKQYYSEKLKFIEAMESSIPTLCELLGSKTLTDVMESIEFFVNAHAFGFAPAMSGIKRMLALIWSRELSVRDAVTDAFQRIFLPPIKMVSFSAKELEAECFKQATQLLQLTYGPDATVAIITSLEPFISQSVAKDKIPEGLLLALWKIFDPAYGSFSSEQRRGAIMILNMIASSRPEIVRTHLNELAKALTSRTSQDPELAKYVCLALQKLAVSSVSEGEHHPKYKVDAALTKRLLFVACECAVPQDHWFGLAEQVINCFYSIYEAPDQVAQMLIISLARKAFAVSASSVVAEGQEEAPASTVQAPPVLLSRLFFAMGHVAFRQYATAEDDFQAKKKQLATTNTVTAPPAAAAAAEPSATPAKKTRGKGSKKTAVAEEEDAEPGLEQELGIGSASAVEYELELAHEQKQHEIVYGDGPLNMVSPFVTLLLQVCANAGNRFSDTYLRSAAVLSLCKLMAISQQFCEENLQLLFTIMQNSGNDTGVRSNIVVALGDMAHRFPNLIERWTQSLYSPLRDPNPVVRKNALMVLTHLILNDMIKVKGQISEMALALEDRQEPRIADLAHLFFAELAKKGQSQAAICNVLPDIISVLSQDPHVPSETFRSIMKYLITFVEKDKQMETLVEKLCNRFESTRELAQWREISFCLAQLNFPEKCAKKVVDSFRAYQRTLYDADVLSQFQVVLSKARKFSKPEMKATLDEWEEKLTKTHVQLAEEHAAGVRAASASGSAAAIASISSSISSLSIAAAAASQVPSSTKKAPKKAVPASTARSKAKKKSEYEDDDDVIGLAELSDEDGDIAMFTESEQEEEEKTKVKKTVVKKEPVKKAAASAASASVPVKKEKAAAKPASRSRRIVHDSEDDE